MSDANDRLRDALASSDAATLAAWAATGVDGVAVLRRELGGPPALEPSAPVHPRDVIDNLAAATAAIAEAQPEAFLDAFAEPAWATSSFVLIGFGRIDDPRATEMLLAGAVADDWTVRMQAAIGLGRRPDPRATATLVRLLREPDDVVRYHAFRSLERIGDATALPALDGRVWSSPFEASLATEARDAIRRRATER